MAVSAYPGIDSSWMFMVGLFVFVALGAGGIKANVSTLGGDQFDATKPQEAAQQATFFNYFYWAINIGALVAYGYLSQVSQNGSGIIPADKGFFSVFVICGATLTLAVAVFVAFSGRYTKVPPSSSALADFAASFVSAARSSWKGTLVLAALASQVLGWILATASAFLPSAITVGGSGVSLAFTLALFGMVLCLAGLVTVIILCEDPQWVYSSKKIKPHVISTTSTPTPTTSKKDRFHRNSVLRVSQFVRNPSMVEVSLSDNESSIVEATSDPACSDHAAFEFLRIMPTLMYSVVFWVVYDQMAANFYSQACQTNLFITQVAEVGGAQLTGSVLQVADAIAVIICIPIFDSFVYPLVERAKGSPYTPLQKVGTGFVAVFLAMATAIGIEHLRRHAPLLQLPDGSGPAVSQCSSGGQAMSDLSVYWMIIPYFLVGVAECLVNVQLYEVCYNEVPASLRSTAAAVNLFMAAIGGSIAGAISKSLAGYVHDDMNTSNIEYQYYVAAGLCVVTLPAFVYSTRKFEYNARDGGKAKQEKEDKLLLSQLELVVKTKATLKLQPNQNHILD
jgi:dipeptide/tripeptide permease